MIKKKYIQINGSIFRTYKRYKMGSDKENKMLYIYVLKQDNALRKFKVVKITKYKNCIIYHIEFVA